jgi:hypothetical protein
MVAQMKPTIVSALRNSKYKKELAETGLWQFAESKPSGDWDETEGQGPDMGRSAKRIDVEQAAFKKGGWSEVKKLRAAQSPDDKMQTFNSIQEKNQTLQEEKSGSPTIISTVEVGPSSTTNQTGGVFTLPNPVAAPKLTTSLPS